VRGRGSRIFASTQLPGWHNVAVYGPSDVVALLAVAAIPLLSWRAVGREFALLCTAIALIALFLVGSPAIPVALAGVLLGIAVLSRLRPGDYGRSARSFGRECVLILGGMAVYTGLRYIESDADPAYANLSELIAFEKSLGLYFEPDLQAWVLRSDTLTRLLNWMYSFTFLAVTAAALLWLWFVDAKNYRLLRNTLGVSAALAIVTIMLFPVAPPRLLESSGMLDTVVLFGREHSFANEYAAVPSLHVGWMVAVGFAFAASIGGRRGAVVGVLPAAIMTVTVIATGNHLWIDGAIGAVYALVVAFALSGALSGPARRSLVALDRARHAVAASLSDAPPAILDNAKAAFSIVSLGALLAYLIVGQVMSPGFTDFWGYLVGQVAFVLLLVIAGEVIFAREGGFSWLTHIIGVVCCYADVLGTDGNLYARIDEYDKLTHFAGVAAITAAAYDIFRALHLQGRIGWTPNTRLVASVVLGVAIGIAWEVYELLGDKVFNTARVYGPWDITYDIVSDTLGALSVALLLWLFEQRQAATGGATPPQAEPQLTEQPRREVSEPS
jgi:hypothetical protein